MTVLTVPHGQFNRLTVAHGHLTVNACVLILQSVEFVLKSTLKFVSQHKLFLSGMDQYKFVLDSTTLPYRASTLWHASRKSWTILANRGWVSTDLFTSILSTQFILRYRPVQPLLSIQSIKDPSYQAYQTSSVDSKFIFVFRSPLLVFGVVPVVSGGLCVDFEVVTTSR